MQKKHAYSLNAYRALLVFFDNYADIVEKTPILKEDVATFRELVNDITDKTDPENTVMTISTSDKLSLRTKITENIIKSLSKIKAQAIKDKNEDLKTEAGTTINAFQVLSETSFLELARAQVKIIQNYPTILAKYSLTAQFITELDMDVETYGSLLPKMSVQKSKSKVATGALTDIFKETKEFLNDVLTAAVETVSLDNPIFVQEFNEISSGRTPSVSPTTLILTVVDDASNLPCMGVKIESKELNYNELTSETGKLTIKTGAKKDMVFTISKNGMITQEIKVSKIMKGHTLELEIRMIAV